MRATVVLVPVTGLLADRLAGLEHADLALRLVLDRTADRADRVDVLDLAARPELGAGQPDADVRVDAHGALLHLGVGRADGDEDRAELADVGLGLVGRPDVGTAHDLDERDAGTVEVDQREVAAVDATAAPTDVGRLARVLLQVRAFDADADAAGQVEPAVDADRLVVLADLIRLGHVRVEVVLAGERRALHPAVERQSEPHRQLHRLTVEHRERTGQPERHRIDVRVRLVAEAVRRPREELGARGQFDVDFESDHHLVAVERPGPGGRVAAGLGHRGALRSSSAAVRNMRDSWSAGANTCTPTGRPSSPVPNGTLMAGSPVRFDGIV